MRALRGRARRRPEAAGRRGGPSFGVHLLGACGQAGGQQPLRVKAGVGDDDDDDGGSALVLPLTLCTFLLKHRHQR
jgi:hypothetical protein